jgi:RNA polymerase sigma-70 factor, ECF subfamily
MDPRTDHAEQWHAEQWALVAAAQAGDSDAFAQLYEHYVSSVFRFVLYRVADRPTAEDLTSETFLRALRRIDSVSYQGRDVGAWFITIARNLVYDLRKSHRYRYEIPTGEMIDSAGETTPHGAFSAWTRSRAFQVRRSVMVGASAQNDPADVVADEIYANVLAECVAQLNDKQREVIELRFYQGLSVAETTAALGGEEGRIKALQHRAVRKLAAMIPDPR